MRLPAMYLDKLLQSCEREGPLSVLGLISFEQRSTYVVQQLSELGVRANVHLLEIHDPADAYPDYTTTARHKINENRQFLIDRGVKFGSEIHELLSSEDDLLTMSTSWHLNQSGNTWLLDATSLPKRFFCFILKQAMLDPGIPNVIVTYTEASLDGYTGGHLAEDPMTCDHLPGFAAPQAPQGSTLVIAVGFEAHSIQSILDVYRDQDKHVKIILPFPPGITSIRRQWNTLRQLAADEIDSITQDNIEVISAWDAEQVFHRLKVWHDDSDGLTLAPFGPKPHTLGMALFAMKYDCGMYYTQPKSYNPEYSRGHGSCWGYLAKWNGKNCYDQM